jgi:hypothetical protein
MKVINHVLIFCLLLVAGCGRQKSVDPTPEALASFESRFGKDISARWELSADKLLVASFTNSGHPSEAYFSEDGKWIKSETEYISSELPSVIVQTVLGAYKGSSISKSLKIEETDKETIYRLSLKRGGNITEVELSSGGVILGTPMMR